MMENNQIGRGWMSGESQYVSKTKEEIRQLALDNLAGQVFGTWNMQRGDFEQSLRIVFMPLFFMTDFDIKELERDGISHIYGYLHQALNRSINGMPIFTTVYMINDHDLQRVFRMQNLISALEEEE